MEWFWFLKVEAHIIVRILEPSNDVIKLYETKSWKKLHIHAQWRSQDTEVARAQELHAAEGSA